MIHRLRCSIGSSSGYAAYRIESLIHFMHDSVIIIIGDFTFYAATSTRNGRQLTLQLHNWNKTAKNLHSNS